MTKPDQSLEAAIIAAGTNVAPRVTPADVEANIVSEWYFTAGDGAHGAQTAEHPGITSVYDSALDQLMFCVLVLGNGFTITGESACASPENFNAEIGRRIARENAMAKVWSLMGDPLALPAPDAPKLLDMVEIAKAAGIDLPLHLGHEAGKYVKARVAHIETERIIAGSIRKSAAYSDHAAVADALREYLSKRG